jgi:hypothetical protein
MLPEKLNNNLYNNNNSNAYSVYFNKKIPENEIESYENFSNKISTSKYTWYNCIPKILIQQFSKYANVYFLLIMFMQVNFIKLIKI